MATKMTKEALERHQALVAKMQKKNPPIPDSVIRVKTEMPPMELSKLREKEGREREPR